MTKNLKFTTKKKPIKAFLLLGYPPQSFKKETNSEKYFCVAFLITTNTYKMSLHLIPQQK